VVIFLCLSGSSKAQTKVYATVPVSNTNTDNPGNATDSNLLTKADVKATCGVAGFGATTGDIIIEFSTPLAANTTTFIKVATDEALLGSLIQGGLGTLVGALLGSQEFTVEARSGTTPILTGNSNTPADFATERLRVVQNSAGEFFIRITPNATYNRIRLVNRYVAVLGLNGTKRLYVYDAFTISGSATCGEPVYTSTSATSVVSLGDAGVTNAPNVLTASTSDFSVLNVGILGVGPSIEQTIYFEGSSQASDTFGVRLSASASLLTAGIASNVSVIASYQGAAVQTKTLAELITLNALTMTGGQVTTLYMSPGGLVDRITVRLSSVAGVAQSLNFYGVTKTLALPVISAYSAICSGNTIALTATVATGNQINWYTLPSGGTIVATTNSGVAFVTPALTSGTTYYAEQFSGSCTGVRIAVPITVISNPIAGVIAGDQTVCLTNMPALITSTSADSGGTISYRWESSLDEVLWTSIPSSNTTTYQPPVLPKSTFFRRITINTVSGVPCESVPTNNIKVTTKNCMVYANPMVRQRVKNGA
jgi:hypothetical protein